MNERNSAFEDISKREGWYSEKLIDRIIKNNGRVTGIKEVPDKWQKVFVTALEISPEYHLRVQSSFQHHCNNAISKTVNLPNETTVEQVKKIIQDAYDLNLKGLTVYRTGSRSKQVMNTKSNCIECEEGVCPISVEG